MSVMRKVLLAMSTSTFLREQATKRAFVRKSVSAFMPGEKVEDALGAAAALKPQKIKELIMASVDKLPQLKDKVSTGGRVNAYAALMALRSKGGGKTTPGLIASSPVSLLQVLTEQ